LASTSRWWNRSLEAADAALGAAASALFASTSRALNFWFCAAELVNAPELWVLTAGATGAGAKPRAQ
jgi:hypothetical protein